jgi:hypothetical protein
MGSGRRWAEALGGSGGPLLYLIPESCGLTFLPKKRQKVSRISPPQLDESILFPSLSGPRPALFPPRRRCDAAGSAPNSQLDGLRHLLTFK